MAKDLPGCVRPTSIGSYTGDAGTVVKFENRGYPQRLGVLVPEDITDPVARIQPTEN